MNINHFILTEETKDEPEARALRSVICLQLSRLGPAVEVLVGEDVADRLIFVISKLEPNIPLPEYMIERLTLMGVDHPGGTFDEFPEPTHSAPAAVQ
jgi:hypothetical protein